jgi:hypothetical protein
MAYETNISASDLTFGSLFRIFFWTSLAFWLLFGAVLAVLALLGMDTVNWNGQPVHGVQGLITGSLISAVIGAIVSSIGGLISALVVKLFGRFLPLSNLRSTRQSFANVSTVFSDSD